MPRRYLFGPVTADFAGQNLYAMRQAGACRAFNHRTDTDLPVTAGETWGSLCARLPAGWAPDFLVLNLSYNTIPRGLWEAPVPLVGLAGDWNFLYHHYRRVLPGCDLVFVDRPGVEVLLRQGFDHVHPANLFGLERAFLEDQAPEGERDIDVLFVGNLHPAVQRERLAWLGRVARLADRHRVVIATGVFGEQHRALLRRARVVFNRSVHGECNRRAFEAAASGALLFQERGNAEVAALFRDRQECVFYGDDDLEELLEHYLTQEDERRAIAETGRQVALSRPYAFFWDQLLEQVDARWPALQERVGRRPKLEGVAALLARAEQAVNSVDGADLTLPAELGAALPTAGEPAALHNALGVAAAVAGQTRGVVTATAAGVAARHFRESLVADPTNVVAALNLVEALVGIQQNRFAAEAARQALALLDRQPDLPASRLDAPRFPPGFDLFRVEWERAAWGNAGSPRGEARAKVRLLRWRLHTLLAELTGELTHYHEAAVARPDLPRGRAALGCALARAGRPAEAVSHLRFAAEADPFDREAAKALCQALTDAGDAAGARRFAREQRLLCRAAPQAVPAEVWFTDAPPVGDELASITVLCCNELDYTKRCLDSVLRHTRRPYELVLVDNASADGTPEFLAEVRARPGAERVAVLRNEKNVGFPAGCNQGLAEARGRYVVFLNNDTVVTEGWLEGLIAWALHDWPQVGLVGAVTNYASPPQQVPVDYPSLDGLGAFAARRRREFAGQALEYERLSGFCLLARREVLEQVGPFDERFGLGFFDDDDLGLRVRKAGLKLLIAQDVFVHHFGSRTFTGLGVDCQAQLRENLERFKEKWGPAAAAPYRLPDGTSAAAAPPAPVASFRGQPRVSLCMIVKDEEHNLPACLQSVADLVDEIVVVDTGSTDRTKEVAARFNAKVVDFAWVDSFSAARNESLRHATGQWIFWMDADDRLDAENREKLRSLFAPLKPENAAYSMKCLCLPDAETGTATVVDHVRLFRNDPALRWEHRIHEQILPAIRRLGADVRFSDVVVHHAGYQDRALRQRKLQRDLRLLELERAELGDHPFTLFNLGSVSQEQGRHAEALALLRRSLERSHPSDSIVRKLYALIVSCHRAQGQLAEAVAACQEGLRVCPDDAELLFNEAMLRREQKDLAGAEACLKQLMASSPGAHFASVDAGLRGYKARQNLGVIYREQGRLADAEAEWKAVTAERPEFLPAWLALAELYLGQQRWLELDETVRHLEALPQGRLEAAVLTARGELARRDFAAARQRLERVIGEHPQAVWPRVILSHVLLQEGRDLAAAERALRDVLALDPQHAEARGNLAVLLQERQRAASNQVFTENVALAKRYADACETPSDIHEHLPTLYRLAKGCRHVTEFGTRTAVSTTALLHAQPAKLVCYDRVKFPQVERLKALAGPTEFVFVQKDVLWAEIEETDLLFLDTLHDYDQLAQELKLHAAKARKYIVLHDTTTFAEKGETEGHKGLWPAVEEFLREGTFRLAERYTNNNGLAVLERVGPPAPAAEG
jgi:GT2 family glycosyltransferase/predicted Zn-dependent protease